MSISHEEVVSEMLDDAFVYGQENGISNVDMLHMCQKMLFPPEDEY